MTAGRGGHIAASRHEVSQAWELPCRTTSTNGSTLCSRRTSNGMSWRNRPLTVGRPRTRRTPPRGGVCARRSSFRTLQSAAESIRNSGHKADLDPGSEHGAVTLALRPGNADPRASEIKGSIRFSSAGMLAGEVRIEHSVQRAGTPAKARFQARRCRFLSRRAHVPRRGGPRGSRRTVRTSAGRQSVTTLVVLGLPTRPALRRSRRFQGTVYEIARLGPPTPDTAGQPTGESTRGGHAGRGAPLDALRCRLMTLEAYRARQCSRRRRRGRAGSLEPGRTSGSDADREALRLVDRTGRPWRIRAGSVGHPYPRTGRALDRGGARRRRPRVRRPRGALAFGLLHRSGRPGRRALRQFRSGYRPSRDQRHRDARRDTATRSAPISRRGVAGRRRSSRAPAQVATLRAGAPRSSAPKGPTRARRLAPRPPRYPGRRNPSHRSARYARPASWNSLSSAVATTATLSSELGSVPRRTLDRCPLPFRAT